MNRLFGLSAAAALGGLGCLLGASETFATIAEDFSTTKTATGTFTQVFDWTIGKTADKTAFDLEVGDSETVTYTIVLTKTTGATTDAEVSGTITLTHNSGGAITISSITDTVNTETALVLDKTTDCVDKDSGAIAANTKLSNGNSPWSCPYGPIALADDSIVARTNIATANGSVSSAAIAINFTQTATVNDTINITDNMGTPSQTVFNASGQATIERTFTFANTCEGETFVNGEAEVVVTNIAEITETSQNDDATVTITCIAPLLDVTKELILGPDGEDDPEDPAFGTIDIGVDVTQIFTYKITISAADPSIAEGAVVFDHVGAEYDLNCDEADPALDPGTAVDCELDSALALVEAISVTGNCMVGTRRPDSAYKDTNIPEKQPEFIIIEVGDLSLSGDMCMVTVDVMTDEHVGGEGSPAFAPTGCLAFTDKNGAFIRDDGENIIFDWLVLNPGVEAFDPVDGHLLFGPVAGLKLEPLGCPAPADADGDDVPDVLDQCPDEGLPNTGIGEILDSVGCIRQTQCSDTEDNDLDGDTDLDDAQCDDIFDDNETAQCDDGVDNDFDGDIDLTDVQCFDATDDDESS